MIPSLSELKMKQIEPLWDKNDGQTSKIDQGWDRGGRAWLNKDEELDQMKW